VVLKLEGSAFLSALQIADSFFPLGTVTLSYGLETFVDEGGANSQEDFEQLLADYLTNLVGASDSVALANAYRAAAKNDLAEILDIDRMLYSVKLVKESRESSARTGRRMLNLSDRLTSGKLILRLKKAVDANRTPGNHAVVLGVLSFDLGITCLDAILIALYTFSVGFLGSAVRLGRLNALQSQGILARTAQTMQHVAAENMDRPMSQMRLFAPIVDVMGMKHQRANKRLFVS